MTETTKPKRRFSFSLRTLLVVVVVLGVILSFGIKLWRWGEDVKAEYVTAQTIKAVTHFVERNQGQWPTSWSDISGDPYHARYVRIRFDLTSERIVADPSLIYSAIVPVTGRYTVYPHATRHLDYLLERLRELNAPTTPVSPREPVELLE